MDPTSHPPLSPAAQAVLDAAYALPLKNGQPSIAAALRAAADEIDAPLSITHIPEQQQSWYRLGVSNLKRKLFAIAADLESYRG